MRKLFVISMLLLLVAVPTLAQRQYATIAGSVVDNQRQALPGVTVTLSGPFMQGSRTAITDEFGRFRFAPVPPGSDYSLKFELSGFNTIDQSGVLANVGRETTLDVEMTLSQFAETITVSAERIVVDTTKSTVDTQVDWGLIDTLSNNRTFQSVMQLAPGVQMGANNPRVHGAADDDNIYLVDGVDTTDPRTQTWGTAINYDTIAEVQVQTAGYNAEYGRVTGGIVNLVTKSGGNEFHGILRLVVSDKDWAADPKSGRTPQTLSDEKRPAASIGGPIAKDVLWFFASYESRDRKQLFPRATDATNSEFYQDTSSYKGHYASGKLTWQLNPNHSIVGWYNEDPIDITNAWSRYYLGTGVAPRSEATQQQGGNTYTAQWTGVLTSALFLEGRYGYYNGEINVVPQGPLGPDPTYYDVDTDYWSGTTLEYYTSKRQRQDVSLSANYFLETASSTHQLKAGLEWLENKNTVVDAYYPSGGPTAPGELILLASGDPIFRGVRLDRPGQLVTKNPYLAFYVQDAWKMDKLTVNAGLRFEQITLKNNVGKDVVKFDFQDQIAPRLGFAYDLNGDSIHGSAARFYDIISDYVTAGLNYNPEKEQDYEPDGQGGWIPLGDPYPLFTANMVNPNIKPTYTDEFTIGYDKRLTNNLAATVNFIWREQKRAIEDFDSGTNGDPVADDGAFYYTNVPGTWMKYQGVEISLKKRMSADRIQFITSYTYAFKNDGYSSRTAFASQLGDYGDTSVSLVDRYGKLDTKSLLKFNGSYTFDFGLITGLSAYYYTGPVYNVYTPVSVDKGTGYQFTEPAGAGKVGKQWTMDLHVEQGFHLGVFQISAYGDVLNVTDNQDPTARQGRVTSSIFGRPTSWQTPRTYQLGLKVEF